MSTRYALQWRPVLVPLTLCRQEGCWSDECGCTTYHDRFRAIFTVGYRYLDLNDQLGINGETDNHGHRSGPDARHRSLCDQRPVQYSEHVQRRELGLKFEFQRNRWSLDVFPRVALGSTHSGSTINGSTVTTNAAGAESTAAGGLLAQPTNIGTHVEDFSVVPEIDLEAGQLTPHASSSWVTPFCTGITSLGPENRSIRRSIRPPCRTRLSPGPGILLGRDSPWFRVVFGHKA